MGIHSMGFFQTSTKSRPYKFTLSSYDQMCFGSARVQFDRAVWKASTEHLNKVVSEYHAKEEKAAENNKLYRLFIEHGYKEPEPRSLRKTSV